jgi:hypothetical protein
LSSPKRPDRFVFSGYQAFFPGVKRPVREVKHSLPSSTEFENEWSYISIPIFLHVVRGQSGHCSGYKKQNILYERCQPAPLHHRSSARVWSLAPHCDDEPTPPITAAAAGAFGNTLSCYEQEPPNFLYCVTAEVLVMFLYSLENNLLFMTQNRSRPLPFLSYVICLSLCFSVFFVFMWFLQTVQYARYHMCKTHNSP